MKTSTQVDENTKETVFDPTLPIEEDAKEQVVIGGVSYDAVDRNVYTCGACKGMGLQDQYHLCPACLGTGGKVK